MGVGILKETDRNVGGIDVLDQMLISPINFHQQKKDNRSEICEADQIDNQGFVGTFWIQDFVQRFLGRDMIFLLEDCRRYYLFNA